MVQRCLKFATGANFTGREVVRNMAERFFTYSRNPKRLKINAERYPDHDLTTPEFGI